MTTKIYLLRHGQTEWNVLNKVQGLSDIELTQEGIKQSEKSAQRLINEDIDLIYSSDLKRARDTAKIIGNKLDLEVKELCGIREIDFGVWEGMELATIKKDHHDHYKSWRTEPHNLKLAGGEDLNLVQKRALKDVRKIVGENEGKNILLVSHGTAIKTLVLGLLELDISNYTKIAIGNAGLSIIELRQYSPVITVLNDTNHLKED